MGRSRGKVHSPGRGLRACRLSYFLGRNHLLSSILSIPAAGGTFRSGFEQDVVQAENHRLLKAGVRGELQRPDLLDGRTLRAEVEGRNRQFEKLPFPFADAERGGIQLLGDPFSAVKIWTQNGTGSLSNLIQKEIIEARFIGNGAIRPRRTICVRRRAGLPPSARLCLRAGRHRRWKKRPCRVKSSRRECRRRRRGRPALHRV